MKERGPREAGESGAGPPNSKSAKPAAAREGSKSAEGVDAARGIPTLGMRTLLVKEVRRFLRVPGQTILSPIITTTLYFVVFGFSLGDRLKDIDGVPYAKFIVPGLVTLGVVSTAFLNTASSMFVMKLQGTILDLLVSPLSYGEILAAFVGAAVLRSLLVGVVTWGVAGFFGGFELAHPLFALAMLLLVAIAFASLGFVTAVWATSFEQINFIPTFIITPLTFLGGVFYSVRMLPPALRRFTLVNPVFYMVDGVRHGMLGRSDTSAATGVAVLVVLCAGALGTAYAMLRTGYKLRG